MLLGGCMSEPEPLCPRLTFLQFYQTQLGVSSPDYAEELFRKTRSLGFKTVILQWSSYDDVSFYESSGSKETVDAKLKQMIQAGCRSGIKFWLGLHHDSHFWEQAAASPDEVKVYLDKRLLDLQLRLPALLALLRQINVPDDCIHGWYISDEIDDMTWSGDKQKKISDYLGKTSKLLREVRPDWLIAISGFTNQAKSPDGYARFWDELLNDAQIDYLFFQDGIGAGKLTLQAAELYISALATMARRRPYSVVVVLELFDMQLRDGKTQYAAANQNRVRRQLRLTEKATGGGHQTAVFAASPYLLQEDMPGSLALAKFWRQRVIPACARNP